MATRCERCGHASTLASRPYNRGICAACWDDIESLEDHVFGPVITPDQVERLRTAGLLDEDDD